MATVLFAWESGGGLGHMMQMLPLAQGLARRGHRVCVALRHLSGAAAGVFGRAGVRFVQAPFKSSGPREFRRTLSFAHVLGNVGWGEFGELFVLACAWRHLIDSVGPDLVVFDHAPSALLASRALARPARRVLLGSGFCCPPDESPLPPFAVKSAPDPAALAEDEGRVLARANRVLGRWGRPPLGRLGQLYSEVDENFLTTFPELEQHPSRKDARYWGPVLGGAGGEAPQWPAGEGKRVFAYLKPFPALPAFLKALGGAARPTVVYIDGINATACQQFETPTLRFERQRVDLPRACRECDVAVLHAGQGATAAALLAGKPVLQIPLVVEQQLTARAVERLGAGVAASAKDGADVSAKLDDVLGSDRYAEAARRFAAKYVDFDPAKQVERMVGRVEELLTGDAAGGAARSAARERERAGVFCG